MAKLAGGNMQGFERHAITILVSVITAVLVWIGYTTNQTAIGVAELRVEMRTMTQSSQDTFSTLDRRVRYLERSGTTGNGNGP